MNQKLQSAYEQIMEIISLRIILLLMHTGPKIDMSKDPEPSITVPCSHCNLTPGWMFLTRVWLPFISI